MRLSAFIPLNAPRVHSGIDSFATSLSLEISAAVAFTAGTCISSYPFLAVRNEPGGSVQLRFAILRLPSTNVRGFRSIMRRAEAKDAVAGCATST
eukprot:CAMPEP_0119204926 /NCGR_PEP_ID=MMETSP1316-20130426/38759_1 /TAXON_ID=41880 /ORGANISM="Pycnococcus provasolii, Strain RCC2336" /LENGTH=94 /DNA_ID=CAMNT_0007201267 /DNA_START=32 /DNA_END=312 /DNA_ORIENTATION=+